MASSFGNGSVAEWNWLQEVFESEEVHVIPSYLTMVLAQLSYYGTCHFGFYVHDTDEFGYT